MVNAEDNVKKILGNCIHCDGSGECKSIEDGLITECISLIVPTDEELALLAEASQKVIDRIKEQIHEQATKWEGMDHPLTEYSTDEYKGYGHLSRPFFIEGNLYSSSPDNKRD